MSIRNYTTPEGHELGGTLAKWCDDAEPQARLKFPELPPRCNSCASGKRFARHADGCTQVRDGRPPVLLSRTLPW